MNKPRLSVVVRVLGILGPTLGAAVFLASQFNEPQSPDISLIKWSNHPTFSAPGWYDRTAVYDWVAFSPGVWQGRHEEQDELVSRNADIMLGEYFNVHTASWWWERSRQGTYTRDLWEAFDGRIAVTTEGDTACIWKNQPMYDFMDPSVRADLIEVLRQHVVIDRVDWLFLDYISAPLPRHMLRAWPQWEANVHGELDFDRDGIGHWDDPDEVEAVKRAYMHFVIEMRAALPEGTKLVTNGALALVDDEVARLLDGCFVEDFPQYFFGGLAPNWTNALDINYVPSIYSLTQERWREGRGIVMLGNRYNLDWTDKIPELPGLSVCYLQLDEGLPPVPHEKSQPPP